MLKFTDTMTDIDRAKRTRAGRYLCYKNGFTPELHDLIKAKPHFIVRTVNGHEITETVNRKAEWEARRRQQLDNEQGAQTNA